MIMSPHLASVTVITRGRRVRSRHNDSVRNKLFSEFARSQPAEGGPRPEWPRLSFWGLVRSGSRSDPFRGPGCAGCTKMHYSPGNLPEIGGWAAPSSPPLYSRAPSPPPFPGPRPELPGNRRWSRTRARARAVTWRDSRGAVHGTPMRDTALH